VLPYIHKVARKFQIASKFAQRAEARGAILPRPEGQGLSRILVKNVKGIEPKSAKKLKTEGFGEGFGEAEEDKAFSGKNVRDLRAALKLNMAEFALLIGVSSATIERWETTKGALRLQARTLKASRKVRKDCKRKKS